MKKIFACIIVIFMAGAFSACEKTNYKHPMYRGK
jgi:hypothetical protein